jgi:hypothetical protein
MITDKNKILFVSFLRSWLHSQNKYPEGGKTLLIEQGKTG